jgi:hypothetical protein
MATHTIVEEGIDILVVGAGLGGKAPKRNKEAQD